MGKYDRRDACPTMIASEAAAIDRNRVPQEHATVFEKPSTKVIARAGSPDFIRGKQAFFGNQGNEYGIALHREPGTQTPVCGHLLT
jgi:hypothetical protein